MITHVLHRGLCPSLVLLVLCSTSVVSAQPPALRSDTSKFSIGDRVSAAVINRTDDIDLMTQTVGNVSDKAVARYGSDFESYYCP